MAFANKVLTYVIVIFDINKAKFLASFAVHLYEIYMLLVCALSMKYLKKINSTYKNHEVGHYKKCHHKQNKV